MAQYIFDNQTNYGFPLTFEAAGKAPLIAKRIWATYVDALEFANDVSSLGTAVPGLVLSVISDSDEKKNGIYRIVSVASAVGEGDAVLEKIGEGTGSITATTYSVAKTLAHADNLGQVIYVTTEEPNPEDPEHPFTAGPYIVNGEGSVSKLGTTSASGDIQGDVEVLKGDVADIKAEISGITEDIETIEGEISGITGEISALTESVEAISGAVETLMGGADIEGSVDNKIAAALTEYATSADTVEAISTAKDEAIGAASAYTDGQISELSAASEVTITVASEATSGYLKTYVFSQGEAEIGKIDIPKDLVVTSGEIIVVDDEHPIEGLENGKYLKLTIANQDNPVYINVKDLCDVYTGDGETIEISSANVISLKASFSGTIKEDIIEEVVGDKEAETTTGYTIADVKRALEAAKAALGQDIADEATARAEADAALLGDSAATATSTTGYTIADVKRALEAAKAALAVTAGSVHIVVTSAETGTTIDLSADDKEVIANALVGITEGAASGVEVDEGNTLNFSKISINCGEF